MTTAALLTMRGQHSVSLSLSCDYLAPMPAGEVCLIEASVVRPGGRIAHMACKFSTSVDWGGDCSGQAHQGGAAAPSAEADSGADREQALGDFVDMLVLGSDSHRWWRIDVQLLHECLFAWSQSQLYDD